MSADVSPRRSDDCRRRCRCLESLGLSAGGRSADASSARAGPDRRSDRLRQDDDAGRAGRRHQPPRARATSSPSKIRSSTNTRIANRSIEQIEIGIDAPDFPTALRSALRQAPDVIVVGEMRDPETMQIARRGRRDRTPRASRACIRRTWRRRSRESPIRSRRSADHDPPGAVDGIGGGDDADAAAEAGRWTACPPPNC